MVVNTTRYELAINTTRGVDIFKNINDNLLDGYLGMSLWIVILVGAFIVYYQKGYSFLNSLFAANFWCMTLNVLMAMLGLLDYKYVIGNLFILAILGTFGFLQRKNREGSFGK